MSNIPVKTLSLLPLYCVQYTKRDTSLYSDPLQDTDTDMEPLNLPFSFRQVGHCWSFTIHYAWSCPHASLLLLPSSSRIYASFLILLHPHHLEDFLVPIFSPLYHISVVSVSITPRLHLRILCHYFLPPLSSCVSSSVVVIIMIPPCIFHLPSSNSYRISSSAILFILHLCCASSVP